MSNLKLGTLIDRLYKQNQVVAAKKRLVAKAETVVKREQSKSNVIIEEIRDRFKQGDINGAVGCIGRAEIKTITSAQLFDWAKLAKYVIKENAVDLFQRRINKSAWIERLADRKNKPIPGIKKYDRVVLSVTKKGK